MRRFKSLRQAKFLCMHATASNLFNLSHHLVSAKLYRFLRLRAFASWGLEDALKVAFPMKFFLIGVNLIASPIKGVFNNN